MKVANSVCFDNNVCRFSLINMEINNVYCNWVGNSRGFICLPESIRLEHNTPMGMDAQQ